MQQAVGREFEVQTGSETASEDAGEITDGFSFLTTALLVFAGISVFVGGFLIFNTFSITVVQRTREFAMLRTLGASSRQVLGAVLAEALLIGLLASALGIAGGYAFVELVKLMFERQRIRAAGDQPQADGGQRRRARSWSECWRRIVAAMIPAVRATRVAPLEALREGGGSTEVEERTSRMRTIIAVGLLTVALALLGLGLFVADDEGAALSQMGGGLVLLFIALAMLGGRFVPPIVSVIGAPIESLRGVTGRARARERPARAAAHRHDRGRSDDRRRAGRLRRHLLLVGQGVSQRRDRRADRGRPGDPEQGRLLAPLVAPQRRASRTIEGVGVVAPTANLPVLIEGTERRADQRGSSPKPASQVFDLDFVEGDEETLVGPRARRGDRRDRLARGQRPRGRRHG